MGRSFRDSPSPMPSSVQSKLDQLKAEQEEQKLLKQTCETFFELQSKIDLLHEVLKFSVLDPTTDNGLIIVNYLKDCLRQEQDAFNDHVINNPICHKTYLIIAEIIESGFDKDDAWFAYEICKKYEEDLLEIWDEVYCELDETEQAELNLCSEREDAVNCLCESFVSDRDFFWYWTDNYRCFPDIDSVTTVVSIWLDKHPKTR